MTSMPIKLIVGLGNPGEKYSKTRHNAGFLFLEQLANQFGAKFKDDKTCLGKTATAEIAGQTVRLLMPNTYMNLSGNALVATANYYKIDYAQCLVVHDELDLDAGIARLKLSGGHGGNNGLRDIIQKTSTKEFARLRLGIGHPGVGRDVSNYVLKQPSKSEQQQLDNAMAECLRYIQDIVRGDFANAMNEIHTVLR